MKISEYGILLLLAAFEISAQPKVNTGGVVNAASYLPVGLPDYGIAQGSIFMVFGERMGPNPFAEATAFPLQNELAGTSIRISVGGVTVQAIMLRSAANWAQAIMPSGTPSGDGTLTVTYQGQTSAPVALRVVKSAFGIFTRNQAGSGAASLQNYNSDLERPANSHIEAAKTGQVVTLWGTGLGPVSFDETTPPQTGDLDVPVQVLVNGKVAQVLYKGRSSEFPGLDQINFIVPENVGGCYSPVAVKIDDVVSNFATISIYPQNTLCADSDSFSSNDMNTLKNTGELRVSGVLLKRMQGVLQVPQSGVMQLLIDDGHAKFSRYDLNSFLAANTLFDMWGRAGSCHVEWTRVSSSDQVDYLAQDPIQRGILDAGASLTFTGPQGSHSISFDGDEYEDSLGGAAPGEPEKPPFLEPGNYTVTGAGGRDVGAFTANVQIPAALTWSNKEAVNEINRTGNLTIQWAGGGDPTKERVIVMGSSTDTTAQLRVTFTCLAPASWGAMTIPATILGRLPVSSEWKEGVFPTGAIMVGNAPLLLSSRFSAQGLNYGNIAYALFTIKNVMFR
jgi:uncharacterized protein (TIGR03437 family)